MTWQKIHNGMFGQVVKKSIRKLFPRFTKKGTAISLISKTTAHNNANSAPAKEAVDDYDLCMNGCMII